VFDPTASPIRPRPLPDWPSGWLRGLLLAAVLAGCTGAAPPAALTPAISPLPSAAAAAPASCLPGERGYLRASLRGAIDSELDWRGAALQCEGGARPDGRGLRVSFLGPPDARGRRLRIVFGIAARPGTGASRDAATNLTLIIEGQRRLYGTQGDDRCTVEALVQEPLPVAALYLAQGMPRGYRVAARGYCIGPATALDGSARVYVNRFDFAGLASFDDNDLHATTHQD